VCGTGSGDRMPTSVVTMMSSLASAELGFGALHLTMLLSLLEAL
jgi:hypothetical protein